MDSSNMESMAQTDDQRKYNTEYHKRRREEDPEYHERRKQATRDWKARHVAQINALVAAGKDKPCVDCDKQYPPYCMEYDHVHGEKLFGLAKAARRGVTLQQVRDEIAKCEIRCVLCHRLRHFGEPA